MSKRRRQTFVCIAKIKEARARSHREASSITTSTHGSSLLPVLLLSLLLPLTPLSDTKLNNNEVENIPVPLEAVDFTLFVDIFGCRQWLQQCFCVTLTTFLWTLLYISTSYKCLTYTLKHKTYLSVDAHGSQSFA